MSSTTTTTSTLAPTTTTQAPDPEPVGEPMITDYATPGYPGTGDVSYLEAVLTETYAGFTRVVFEFDAGTPEFKVQYAGTPVVASPSGQELDLEGDAALVISLAAASGVDLTGAAPVVTYSGPDRLELEGASVFEIVKAEDFENHMMWAIGMSEQLPYSFSVLTEPSRVVFDIHLADVTAVAEYGEGERAFAVAAFATTPSDACVSVRVKRVETLCIEPRFGHPIAYQTAWIDDVPIVVGVVFDSTVTDIDLVAVDGSIIAEDAEGFALVDIGNGLRAFAPAIDPTFLREIRALDAEGRLVLQAQVTV